MGVLRPAPVSLLCPTYQPACSVAAAAVLMDCRSAFTQRLICCASCLTFVPAICISRCNATKAVILCSVGVYAANTGRIRSADRRSSLTAPIQTIPRHTAVASVPDVGLSSHLLKTDTGPGWHRHPRPIHPPLCADPVRAGSRYSVCPADSACRRVPGTQQPHCLLPAWRVQAGRRPNTQH